MGKRLVGSKFWANFGSLPDLGKIIAVASFQDDERCGGEKKVPDAIGESPYN